MSAWTQEVELQLIDLVSKRHSCQQISDILHKKGVANFSRCAIIGKVRRLRARGVIPPDPRGSQQKRRTRSSQQKRRTRGHSKPQLHQSLKISGEYDEAKHLARLKDAACAREELARDSDLPSVEATVAIGPCQCRWIESGAYCGERTPAGESWCPLHREVAFAGGAAG